MQRRTNLLKINNRNICTGINLHAIRQWAIDFIPQHSHFYPIQQTQARTKRGYFNQLRRESQNYDPFTWLFDLTRALAYLKIVVETIVANDQERYLCNLRPHVNGEQCPNRIGIIFPEPE